MNGSKVIYKYDLPAPSCRVMMPADSRILSLQYQNGVACVWALLSNGAVQDAEFAFDIYGTGHSIASDAEYIGTLQQGPFVWHYFRRRVS